MKFILLSTIIAFAPSIAAEVVSLTDDNFASAVSGKIAFVKFFAPWCGHCKAMAADWGKLAEDYKDDPSKIIAEVDCTVDETENICESNGIEGFPTLKFGDASWMESYDGDRSYESLSQFANENLKAGCSPVNVELCDGEKKVKMEKYMAMSTAELDDAIDALEDTFDELEDEFDKSTEVLEKSYEKLLAETEAMKKEAKGKADYNILKAVQAVHATNRNDEL